MKTKRRSTKLRSPANARTKQQLSDWLADPKTRESYRKEAESAARGDDPRLTEKDRKAARLFLTHLATIERMETVDAKMKRLLHLVQKPDLSQTVDEALAECRHLLDEVTDDLLETPEPFRTKHLKVIVPIREWFKRDD